MLDRGDARNFSDFEYDANASESDEETSSECDDTNIEDKFGDSEDGPDNDQDAFCEFKRMTRTKGRRRKMKMGLMRVCFHIA